MSQFTISDAGWEEHIYKIAVDVVVKCEICHDKIALKTDGKEIESSSFGVWVEPGKYHTHVVFMCKKCFEEVQKTIDNIKKQTPAEPLEIK